MAEAGSFGHPSADQENQHHSEKHHNDNSSTQGSTGNGLSSPSTEPEDEVPKRMLTGVRWGLAYTSLIVCVFLFSMDNTVVADIQPSIIEAFGGIDKLPWIGLGFQAGAMTVLPSGQAYGTFSLKPLFLTSLFLFELGSAVCGAAPNMNAMIIGRVITGVGGAATYTGCLTYLTVLTTPRERPMYMSGIAVMYSVGSVLGPIVGGGFAHSSATWRWAFYINLPFAALLVPVFVFCLPKIDPQPTMRFVEKLGQQDWVGIVIYYGFSTCFCMAISFGGSVFAWDSGAEITLWVLTGVLLIAFGLVTYYHPFVPSNMKLYPAQIAKKLELDNLQYQLFSAFGCLLITIYYTPLLFQSTISRNVSRFAAFSPSSRR
jgi:MFS family permease